MDTTKFFIRELDGSVTEREPTVGKWYAGLETLSFENEEGEIEDAESYGAIGQYLGEGRFADDGVHDEDFEMGREYTTLAEQH